MLNKTPIIPSKQTFANTQAPHELHLEAICVFVAIGFFLDTDTYWKDLVVLAPATKNKISTTGILEASEPWFQWHYSPRDVSFNHVLEEFTSLFETTIIKEQIQGKKVILPLSGGLDSRTQAVALKRLGADVSSYSYDFKNGFLESHIAKQIAKKSQFDFKKFTIESGYLWHCIDDLFELNKGYSDLTSPRQISVIDELHKLGDVFSLGHWGDVLFNDMGVADSLTPEQQIDVVIKKLLKRGGLELAEALWSSWGLEGSFYDYFYERIAYCLNTIDITNANARIRAFKSKYWAPRWTSVNLSVFESIKSITLPYYDDRMCQFICSVPERFLKGRNIQIEYIKKHAPELASITWQDQRPFNLYNYEKNRVPCNLPYRLINKAQRELNNLIGKPYIQRNWELQFLGTENDKVLKSHLFVNNNSEFISKQLIKEFYDYFLTDNVYYSHSINMLLTLVMMEKHIQTK